MPSANEELMQALMSRAKRGEASHGELMAARVALPPQDPQQALLAPHEHSAYAREWVRDDPLLAIPGLVAMIPGYAAAKGIGLIRGGTEPTVEQVVEGYRGMGRGISDLLGD